MHAIRFGLCLVLSATFAIEGYTAYARDDRAALGPDQRELLTRELDQQLNDQLTVLIASAEIGPDGHVRLSPAISDGHFAEPYSGRYWQVSAQGARDFLSRSLWDRKLQVSGRMAWREPLYYDSDQFANEPLRIVERTVRLPGSDVEWQFVVARSRNPLN